LTWNSDATLRELDACWGGIL